MFRTVSLSIIRSLALYTQQDQDGTQGETQFHPDPARKLYDIYHCCVYSAKLLMMDRETVQNMYSFIPKINLRN